jgi:hypothetical protein
MGPDGAVAGSQWGSARARLEGNRSTIIAPASGVKVEQRNGMGLGGCRAPNRVRCRTISACEEVTLTWRVRVAPGPTWQRPRGGKWHDRFVEMGWAESAVETG